MCLVYKEKCQKISNLGSNFAQCLVTELPEWYVLAINCCDVAFYLENLTVFGLITWSPYSKIEMLLFINFPFFYCSSQKRPLRKQLTATLYMKRYDNEYN